MTARCWAYDDERAARAAVETLIAQGVPGEDVRVLKGRPIQDAYEELHGSFVSGHGDDPLGSFAGEQHGPEGSFAPGHDARRERLGSFGDVDRETISDFPAQVESVHVTSHRKLVRLLGQAGLDRETAERDVQALHTGKVLVVALLPEDDAERAEDALE